MANATLQQVNEDVQGCNLTEDKLWEPWGALAEVQNAAKNDAVYQREGDVLCSVPQPAANLRVLRGHLRRNVRSQEVHAGMQRGHQHERGSWSVS